MPHFKPVIRTGEPNRESKYNIKIRVIHLGKTRDISTKFYIDKDCINNKTGKINIKYTNHASLNLELARIIGKYEEISYKHLHLNCQELVNIIKNHNENHEDFLEYAKKQQENFSKNGQKNSSELVKYTIVTLKKFLKRNDLSFQEINFSFLSRFESFLIQKQLQTNSISIYLRNIRTIFNKAIDENIIGLEYYPFRRFKIKSERTIKRNLEIETIRTLKNANVKGRKAFARDMFLLSFYLIGINLVDLYYLKEIYNHTVIYKRKKTGKNYIVFLLPQARKIIEQYPSTTNVLNVSEIYCNVENFRKAVNVGLKDLCKELKLNIKPTSYYARHSWATIASDLDIPKETISAALGHEIGSKTTAIYIDYDMKKVDKANEMVCNAIL